MNAERLVPTEGDASVVTLSIFVDESELPATVEVLSVTTQRVANRIPFAKLSLRDGDFAAEDFPTSNSEHFVPGRKIEIRIGHASREKTVFKGIVVKHGIKIQASGFSELIVECYDEAIGMTIGRRSKVFEKKKDSEIISELVRKHGLTSKVEASKVQHSELVQYHARDWDFIVARAEANGMIVLVDDGKLLVQTPKMSGEEDVSIVLGDTIFEFEAETDARYQPKSVEAFGWDYSAQEVVSKSSRNSNENKLGNLSTSELAQTINLDKLEMRHNGHVDSHELDAWAKSIQTRNALAKVIGRVQIPGLATVKPGDLVRLNGIGKRFSGIAFVAGVRQEVSLGSWRTELQIGLSPERIMERHDVDEIAAGGLLPSPKGLLIGKVEALEGDPDGEDRIRVSIPILKDKSKGLWARWASPDAGSDRGVFFRPEIGDEVVVGCIGQDPRDVVVLGALHSSTKPAPIIGSDKNKEKAIVTRSKMRIHFDDENKVITIDTPGGNSAVLDDSEKSIVFTDQHSNRIAMNSDGITIEGSKITLQSKRETSLDAGSNLTIGSKANTEVVAGAQLRLDGSTAAEFTSSAIVTIKGSLVKIN